MSGLDRFDTDGLEVELGTGHGEENIDQVVEKKASHDGRGHLLKEGDRREGRGWCMALQFFPENGQYQQDNHGEINPIAKVKSLAPKGLRQRTAELQRRLTTEDILLRMSKEMIKVRKAAVELVGVGIPLTQPNQLSGRARQHRQHRG